MSDEGLDLMAKAALTGPLAVFDALGDQQAIEQGGNYYLTDRVEARNFAAFMDRLPPTGRVLVAACGDGLETEILCDAGYDVTAFDYSPNMVEATRRRVGNRATLFVGDVTRLDLDRHEPYAGVTFAQAAQFLPSIERAITDLAALTAGAFFYSNTRYADQVFEREWLIDGRSYGTTTYHAHDIRVPVGLLARAGLSVVHSEQFDAGDVPPDDYKNDYVVAVRR